MRIATVQYVLKSRLPVIGDTENCKKMVSTGQTALAALPFAGYGVIALAGCIIVTRRIREKCKKGTPHSSEAWLRLLSHIGLWYLTFGTMIDNVRRLFGGVEPGDNAAATGLVWFLEFTHEVICGVCPAIGLQFLSVSTPRLHSPGRWLAATCVVVLATIAIGLYGFIHYSCSEGVVIDTYMGLHVANPAAANPLSLFAIGVLCVTALVASVVLACARGCKAWLWLVACQLLGIVGQALLTSFNTGYEYYGSNFWEQVTIFSLVIADGKLNDEEIDDADKVISEIESPIPVHISG